GRRGIGTPVWRLQYIVIPEYIDSRSVRRLQMAGRRAPSPGSQMLDVSFGGALLAGLLSFVSRCVLPIVPPYLAWLAGVSFDQLKDEQPGAAQRRAVFLSALAFVLGFTTVFVALGATASVIGKTIAQYFDT